MEFDWVTGCGLSWFVGPKFLLCNGLGWVGSVVWCVGLGWIEDIGPTDNSDYNPLRTCFSQCFMTALLLYYRV